MTSPSVVVDTPPSWLAVTLERPPLAGGTGASWSHWDAARSADGSLARVVGCVSAPIPGWVEDMRGPFTARAVALAGAAGERTSGKALEAIDDGATLRLRPPAASEASTRGRARALLGFGPDRSASTCFVACTATSDRPLDAEADGACRALVESARLEGSAEPPSPGALLGAASWAVRHPRETASVTGALVVLAGLVTVLTRRRPRFGG